MALAGCATRIEVRSLGSADPSQAFYEMRGQQLVSLHERADQLCPKGYTVLRQAQTGHAADPRAGMPSKAGMMAVDFLAPAADDAAQLLVQCDALAQGASRVAAAPASDAGR